MQIQKPKQGYKLVKSLFDKFEEIPEDWELRKLSDLAEKDNDIVAGPFGSNLKVSDYKSTGIPIIRLQNIERNQFIDKNIKYVSKKKAEELQYHSYQPNDLILAKLGDPIGKTCKIPENFPAGIVVADVVRIRTSSKKADLKYMEYILNSNICGKQYDKERIGTTRPRVNLEQIRDLQFPCPPLKEQQKIASILSNVDSMIQHIQQEMRQTQKLKKGLMQRLLTKGIGHTKFKKVKSIFGKYEEIPEEWNVKKINEIGEVVRGASPRPAGDPKYFGGLIPWITVGEITKDDNMYLDSVSDGLTEEGKKHSRFFEKGTFIIANSGATLGVPKILKISGCANDGVAAVLNLRELISEYLYYVIYSQINLLRNINQGMGQPNLNTILIGNIQIACPPLIEQQKITSILLNIDSQIQQQRGYKSKLETLKKGLMQKLLTGQIRVKA